MKKYLVTIEFRYLDAPKSEHDYTSKSKEITIGVFDDFQRACNAGNERLEVLESKFPLNPNYNRKVRFSKNGGSFGSLNNLVTNTGYLKTPFDFYAKITTLNFTPIREAISGVADALKRYSEFDNE